MKAKGASGGRWIRGARGVAAALLVAVLVPAGACGRLDGGDNVAVFAAASLRDVLSEIAALPGTPPFDLHLAGSEVLLQQQRSGAPVDLLIMARHLDRDELAALPEPGGGVVVARNRLVVAVHAEAADRPADLDDLLADPAMSSLALADPVTAPAGRHARAALQAQGAWDALQSRCVWAADVRAACTWVAVGEVEAVVCYATDVEALPDLALAFPLEGASAPYEAHVVARSGRRATASALRDVIGGPAAAAVFARHGFLPGDARSDDGAPTGEAGSADKATGADEAGPAGEAGR